MQLLKATVLLLFAFNVLAVSREREREIIKALLLECKDKEGGTQDDFDQLFNEQFPGTRSSKCMTACSLEILGIFSSGKFNRDTFMYVAKLLVGKDPERLQIAIKVADDCGIDGGDRCEQGFKFSRCLRDYFRN